MRVFSSLSSRAQALSVLLVSSLAVVAPAAPAAPTVPAAVPATPAPAVAEPPSATARELEWYTAEVPVTSQEQEVVLNVAVS